MPKTSLGTCTSCLYTGPLWEYLGPQHEPGSPKPVFQYWNCPCCHSSKVSGSADHPPPVHRRRSTP